MINLGGKTVYHLGDTALFTDLALAGERDADRRRARVHRRPLHDGPPRRRRGRELVGAPDGDPRATTTRSRRSRPTRRRSRPTWSADRRQDDVAVLEPGGDVQADLGSPHRAPSANPTGRSFQSCAIEGRAEGGEQDAPVVPWWTRCPQIQTRRRGRSWPSSRLPVAMAGRWRAPHDHWSAFAAIRHDSGAVLRWRSCRGLAGCGGDDAQPLVAAARRAEPTDDRRLPPRRAAARPRPQHGARPEHRRPAPTTSPEDEPGGAGRRGAARRSPRFTGRGRAVTPRVVAVPAFIAIRVSCARPTGVRLRRRRRSGGASSRSVPRGSTACGRARRSWDLPKGRQRVRDRRPPRSRARRRSSPGPRRAPVERGYLTGRPASSRRFRARHVHRSRAHAAHRARRTSRPPATRRCRRPPTAARSTC